MVSKTYCDNCNAEISFRKDELFSLYVLAEHRKLTTFNEEKFKMNLDLCEKCFNSKLLIFKQIDRSVKN